jgi:hypothetical protein
VDFTLVRDAGTESEIGVRPVTVGAEGWQQPDGFTSYRVGKDTYVSIGAAPESSIPAATLALARAMLPAYGG